MKLLPMCSPALICSLLLLSACSSQSQAPASAHESQPPAEVSQVVTFTDALGRAVVLEQPPSRVAAVMGSFAETWLLSGGELIAVTQDAYDERNLELPPATIDLGAMMTPSLEAILAAEPDFLILSAKVSGHVALRDSLEAAGITAAYFEVETFEQYLAMLKTCTDITGRSDLFEANGLAVQSRIGAAVERAQAPTSPTVLYIRAFSTGANAKGSDNMTGAMLKELGCVNIADSDATLLENLSMEAIIAADPDYIFVTTMGSSSQKALDKLKEGYQNNPAWKDLSAVKNDRYIILPKDLFHYKPNARWGESYETLCDLLYGQE